MTPADTNMLATLNLLTHLFRCRKTVLPKLSEQESHTIFVTMEHIEQSKISIPVFINSLEILAKKGYLSYVPMNEQKFHDQLNEFKDSPLYLETLAQIRLNSTKEQGERLRNGIASIFENTIPKNMTYDKEGLMDEQFTIADLFEQGLNVVTSQSEQPISVVVLMPFRSIDRLLNKMNKGMKFDDVQDAGIWYDSDKRKLYFGDESLDTSYQGEPSKVHFVLDTLFKETCTSFIDFSSNTEFGINANPKAENKRFYLSLNHFIKKHPELAKIFTVHADRLEINDGYLEHIN